jgi:hypothetical protein
MQEGIEMTDLTKRDQERSSDIYKEAIKLSRNKMNNDFLKLRSILK